MKRDVSLIILIDKDGKILLQHRDNDAPISPGMWGFFGGAVEEGESFEDAALRETKEELNYVLKDLRVLFKHNYFSLDREGVKYYFVEKCLDKSSIILREGQAMRWVDLDEAKRLNMKKSNLEILEKIFKMLKE